MRKVLATILISLSLITTNAWADALGLYIGGGTWKHDPVGTFGGLADAPIDMVSNLSFTETSDSYVYAAFEHPIPLIPNVRVEQASLTHTGTASGITFNGAGPLTGSSQVKLDSTDAIVYYRLLDNWVNFDVGINARQIEGDFTVSTETVPVSATVPLLYVAAQFDVPFAGLSVGADVNTISVSDVTYQDVRIRALYEFGVVGIEAGLRTTTLELKALDNINADLEFKGLMIGAFLHF